MLEPLILVLGIVVGAAIAFFVLKNISTGALKRSAKEAQEASEKAAVELQSAKERAEEIIENAKSKAESLRKEAKLEAQAEALKIKQENQAENKERLKEVRVAENRLSQREEVMDRRGENLDKREMQISSTQAKLDNQTKDLEAKMELVTDELQNVSGMTSEEAREVLLDKVKSEVVAKSATIIREAEARTRAEVDKNSREILSIAIQRVASDHASELTVNTIHIPSDELKGRIIGREGRNIRSFEQLTGVNLIIDDTPECVTISCFDPVRREIGRVTMESLIADGRIHPARIEEMFTKAENMVNQKVMEAGEQATYDAGIHDLHPELLKTLGRLRYRTSYGQNVLNHSLEVAYLCSVMASELGIDPELAKRAGLLHDIGKAIDHEQQEGGHAVIGAELCRKFGERPEIVHAIEAHHNDVEPNTVIDFLVQAADAVSAARPGARRETLDAYIKRLEKLEEIANAHEGVERTYAIQAGREVRVMVTPEVVDEASTTVLAHDIAAEIERDMQYPGQVKVVVIRESRSQAIAK